MAVKPLKDLMAEADRILGQTKIASPLNISDEVSSLADTLSFATAIEEKFTPQDSLTAEFDPEFEKVAKAVNKASALAEWEVLSNTDRFEEAAMAQGYTEEQIGEALSKIAAAKVKKNLDALVALSVKPMQGENKNSLETKKVKSTGSDKHSLPLTHSLKGGL